jgi:polyhydroxyalkanoate synthesis regulator phasin
MSEGIIIALITAGCSFGASLIANSSANKKLVNDLKLEVTKNQAVTDTKIEELTREVREHNNFARRMPVVEEQIKVINHRIEDLEHKI